MGGSIRFEQMKSRGVGEIIVVSLLLLPVVVVCAMSGIQSAAAEGEGEGVKAGEYAVHIVYMESPQDEEPECYHIRTLTSVLGSEEAAKQALLYSYRTAASGFSAKLTPEQVAEISNQPGVLQVVPSTTYQLHSGTSLQ